MMNEELPPNERPLPPNEMPPTERPPRDGYFKGGDWIGPGGAVTAGLVLIGLGAIFMLQNFGLIRSDFNWWALFIFMPGIFMIYRAYRVYMDGGEQFTPVVSGLLLGAFWPIFIGAIFLFNLNWGIMWPVILIFIGLTALLRRSWR